MAVSPISAATEFSLRPMASDDAVAGHRLTQQLGWPHTEQDWAFHLEHGRGWAAVDRDETIIGTALLWFYGDHDGTLGLVIVDKAFRGKGIARILMEQVLEAAGARKIRLVATEMAVKLYQNLGFASPNKIKIAQRQGVIAGSTPLPTHDGTIVRVARKDDYTCIRTLDHDAVRMDRSSMINSLLTSSASYVLQREGCVIGSVLVRESGRGKTFGPLIARNEADAKLLLSKALSEHPGFCRIDIPEDAGSLGQWLDQKGLPVIDRGTVMQNFDIQPLKGSPYQIYSLISQALL